MNHPAQMRKKNDHRAKRRKPGSRAAPQAPHFRFQTEIKDHRQNKNPHGILAHHAGSQCYSKPKPIAKPIILHRTEQKKDRQAPQRHRGRICREIDVSDIEIPISCRGQNDQKRISLINIIPGKSPYSPNPQKTGQCSAKITRYHRTTANLIHNLLYPKRQRRVMNGTQHPFASDNELFNDVKRTRRRHEKPGQNGPYGKPKKSKTPKQRCCPRRAERFWWRDRYRSYRLRVACGGNGNGGHIFFELFLLTVFWLLRNFSWKNFYWSELILPAKTWPSRASVERPGENWNYANRFE